MIDLLHVLSTWSITSSELSEPSISSRFYYSNKRPKNLFENQQLYSIASSFTYLLRTCLRRYLKRSKYQMYTHIQFYFAFWSLYLIKLNEINLQASIFWWVAWNIWFLFPLQLRESPNSTEPKTALDSESKQANGKLKRQRRSRVPNKPSYPLNLWSIMKNCIGKELTKIPMPVRNNRIICYWNKMWNLIFQYFWDP